MPGKPASIPGLVSVIMNCYNSDTWLREAIDSVFAQTYDQWEIVFWDNGSTDRSPEIAKSYGDKVKYFRATETVPLGAARRLALEVARGEFIAFLDCDDIWFPEKLARQVEVMRSGPYALCYAGIIEMNAGGKELRRLNANAGRGDRFDELLHQFDVFLPTAMLRASSLAESGLTFDPKVVASEEYCLFMQLAARYQVAALPDTLAWYRVHEKSLTNASIGRWAEEREYTLRRIEETNPGIRSRYRSGFREAYARARYYRARLYVALGERLKALRALAPAAIVHPRYAALCGLLLVPGAWERVHAYITGRRAYTPT
jgi:glycosyltransferase involved in cell wall biosynthesis